MRQRGSALIIGVFVITVMFLLASALINIVEDGDTGLTQEVWGARAFAAANSGAAKDNPKLSPISRIAVKLTRMRRNSSPRLGQLLALFILRIL